MEMELVFGMHIEAIHVKLFATNYLVDKVSPSVILSKKALGEGWALEAKFTIILNNS